MYHTIRGKNTQNRYSSFMLLACCVRFDEGVLHLCSCTTGHVGLWLDVNCLLTMHPAGLLTSPLQCLNAMFLVTFLDFYCCEMPNDVTELYSVVLHWHNYLKVNGGSGLTFPQSSPHLA